MTNGFTPKKKFCYWWGFKRQGLLKNGLTAYVNAEDISLFLIGWIFWYTFEDKNDNDISKNPRKRVQICIETLWMLEMNAMNARNAMNISARANYPKNVKHDSQTYFPCFMFDQFEQEILKFIYHW